VAGLQGAISNRVGATQSRLSDGAEGDVGPKVQMRVGAHRSVAHVLRLPQGCGSSPIGLTAVSVA